MHGFEPFAVVLAEISDGFEIRRQLSHQPDQFHVTMTFPFQRATGADAMQVTVEIKAQQIARSIRRAAGGSGGGLGKFQRVQVQ